MTRTSLSSRAATLLSSRRLPWWLAALAVLVVTPSLGTGLVVDDFVIRAVDIGAPTAPGSTLTPLDVFRFTDGSGTARLVDAGVLPWWSSPGLKLAFFRPLSALSHWLDFHLFPGSPAAMHAVSLAWLGATVFVAVLLYRRLLGAGWPAGLAALFFAVDPGHAVTAGWVAARNAILAAFFGLLAVYAQDRWQRDRERWAAFVAPLACAASLASGESGLATVGLLFVHAITLGRPRLADRVRALAPAAAITIAWAILYRAHGCGAAHSAMYVDPSSSPLEYLRAAMVSIPLNLGARLGGPPAAFGALFAARLLPVLAVVSLGFMVLAGVALAPVVRREPAARFFVGSMLVAVLPIAGTLPNDRNLFFLGFAGFGLAALAAARAVAERSVPARLYAGWLLFLLVLSFPLSLVSSVSMNRFAVLSRDPLSRVLLDDAVRGDTVVFLNPPTQFFVSHLVVTREGTAAPIPARIRALWPGIYGAHVVRTREDQLSVHIDGGMLPRPGTWPASSGEAPAMRWEYLGQQLGSFVRGADDPVRAGEVMELSGCRVEVTTATAAGGPTDVVFTFAKSLDDSSPRFLAWRDGGYVPFVMPRVGEAVDLAPVSMGP
jgi:hypothetical protein